MPQSAYVLINSELYSIYSSQFNPRRIEFQLSTVINVYITHLIVVSSPSLFTPIFPQMSFLGSLANSVLCTTILASKSSFGGTQIRMESYSSHHCQAKSHALRLNLTWFFKARPECPCLCLCKLYSFCLAFLSPF